MASQVYCDIDGVLADFEGAFISHFKRKRFGGQFVHIDGPEWARLKREWPTFWSDLELLPNALTLWRGLLKYKPILLTAPPDGWPDAAVGKRIWAKRMLPKFGYQPGTAIIVVPAVEKQRYAKQADGTPNILIDDMERNITQWKSAGGLGFRYIDSGSADAALKFVQKHMGE